METFRAWLTTALVLVIACAVLYIAAGAYMDRRLFEAAVPSIEPDRTDGAEPVSIDYLVEDGILGTKWGATIAEAQAAVGGGIPEDDGARLWFRGGIDLFRASRGDRDTIQMFFNNTGLWKIEIEYPTCVEISYALRSAVGEPTNPGSYGDAGVWTGQRFELTGTRSDDGVCYVTVERAGAD